MMLEQGDQPASAAKLQIPFSIGHGLRLPLSRIAAANCSPGSLKILPC